MDGYLNPPQEAPAQTAPPPTKTTRRRRLTTRNGPVVDSVPQRRTPAERRPLETMLKRHTHVMPNDANMDDAFVPYSAAMDYVPPDPAPQVDPGYDVPMATYEEIPQHSPMENHIQSQSQSRGMGRVARDVEYREARAPPPQSPVHAPPVVSHGPGPSEMYAASDMAAKDNEIDKLRRLTDDLQAALEGASDYEATIVKLEGERDDLAADLKDTKGQLARKIGLIEDMAKAADGQTGQVDQWRAAVAKREEELGRACDDLDVALKEGKEATALATKRKEAMDALQSSVEAKERVIVTLKADLANKEKAVDAAEAEREDVKAVLAETKKKLESESITVATLQQEGHALRKAVTAATAEGSTASERVDGLVSEIERLRGVVGDLEREKARLEATVTQLQRDYRVLEQQTRKETSQAPTQAMGSAGHTTGYMQPAPHHPVAPSMPVMAAGAPSNAQSRSPARTLTPEAWAPAPSGRVHSPAAEVERRAEVMRRAVQDMPDAAPGRGRSQLQSSAADIMAWDDTEYHEARQAERVRGRGSPGGQGRGGQTHQPQYQQQYQQQEPQHQQQAPQHQQQAPQQHRAPQYAEQVPQPMQEMPPQHQQEARGQMMHTAARTQPAPVQTQHPVQQTQPTQPVAPNGYEPPRGAAPINMDKVKQYEQYLAYQAKQADREQARRDLEARLASLSQEVADIGPMESKADRILEARRAERQAGVKKMFAAEEERKAKELAEFQARKAARQAARGGPPVAAQVTPPHLPERRERDATPPPDELSFGHDRGVGAGAGVGGTPMAGVGVGVGSTRTPTIGTEVPDASEERLERLERELSQVAYKVSMQDADLQKINEASHLTMKMRQRRKFLESEVETARGEAGRLRLEIRRIEDALGRAR